MKPPGRDFRTSQALPLKPRLRCWTLYTTAGCASFAFSTTLGSSASSAIRKSAKSPWNGIWRYTPGTANITWRTSLRCAIEWAGSEYRFPANHGHRHLHLFDASIRHGQEVLGQHDEIGQLPGFDRPFGLLLKRQIRIVRRAE